MAGGGADVDPEKVLSMLRRDFGRPAMAIDEARGVALPSDVLASTMGIVRAATPNETWPIFKGTPMEPILQLNMSEMSMTLPCLEGVAFISLFTSSRWLESDSRNGSSWCLRAYREIGELRPMDIPLPWQKALSYSRPVHFREIAEDLPSWESISDDYDGVPDEVWDEVGRLIDEGRLPHHLAHTGTKLGGWPDVLQDDVPWSGDEGDPHFVFQVASLDAVDFAWSHQGIAHFGRVDQQWQLSFQVLA